MRVVLIPGWNESTGAMEVFVDGRHGLTGLAARGFQCAVFDGGRGSLYDRIDQFAAFLAGLRSSGGEAEPVALFGYSAGGVIARGLLRSRPNEARISAIFQLGTPNAGIVTDDLSALLHRVHFSKSVIEDLDIESQFMRWLNGTTGRWETDPKTHLRHWKLKGKPWVTNRNVPILNLIGRVPHYRNQSDGVVAVDSATLNGHVPHAFVDDRRANHLNLSGSWNPLTLVMRRWLHDDRLWPIAVQTAETFFRAPLERCTQGVIEPDSAGERPAKAAQ